MKRTIVLASAPELVNDRYYNLTRRVHVDIGISGDRLTSDISLFPQRDDLNVVTPWGETVEWNDLENVFPEGVRRNYSYYKESKPGEQDPKRICTRRLARLMYWDLWLRVNEPERMKQIIKRLYEAGGK